MRPTASARSNQRNSYLERPWDTSADTANLRIPKLSTDSYFPGYPEPRRAERFNHRCDMWTSEVPCKTSSVIRGETGVMTCIPANGDSS